MNLLHELDERSIDSRGEQETEQMGKGFRFLSRVFRCVLICLLGFISPALPALAGGPIPGAKPPDVIHLSLWHGVNPPSNRDILQKLVDRFNQEHPSIQVESLYIGQGDQQMPKILAAVVGNASPNLLWCAPMIMGQLVELDAILPLEDWLTTLPVAEQIDPTLQGAIAWEGHTWAVPFDVNNVGIFYRPSLFQAAGITQLPKTWDELRQVAQQLTLPEKDQHGLLLPLGKGEWTVFMWLPFLWSGDGDLVNPTTGKVDLVNSGAIAALQFWQDLIQDGSTLLSQPERGYELDRFLAGKVAMQLTGPWTLGQLQKTGVDFAVMAIPTQVQPATSIGGENLYLFKGTPATEAAAKVFAEYVLSEDFQTAWALGTGYLPVNLKARQSSLYQAFVAEQPVLKTFLEQAPYGRSRPIFPGYNRLSENLGRAIESVLLQKSTPEAALVLAQRRLDLTLSQQNLSRVSQTSAPREKLKEKN